MTPRQSEGPMNRPGVVVTLEKFEVFNAGFVGFRRNLLSTLADSKDRLPGAEDGWTVDIESAAAEMACAKALGIFWGGSVNTYKKSGDVGDYEVRWTDKDNGRLRIYREGNRSHPHDKFASYVLVVGKIPTFRMAGYFVYSNVRDLRDEWLTDFGHPEWPKVHAVPQSALRPIEELCGRKAYTSSPTIENYTRPVETRGREYERHPPECFCDSCCRTA